MFYVLSICVTPSSVNTVHLMRVKCATEHGARVVPVITMSNYSINKVSLPRGGVAFCCATYKKKS